MSKFCLTLASMEDEEKILDLQRAAFESDKFTHEWYDWIFNKCPLGLNRTYLIEDLETGKPAGCNAFRPLRLLYNYKKVNASFSHSTAISPDYRRQGLFTRLIGDYAPGREFICGAPVSIGMPNANSFPGFMKAGYEVICDLPFLEKKNCRLRSHACNKVDRFDERFDPFFSFIAERFSFILLKDHKFMNWRTVERPDVEYTIYVYPERAPMQAFVVLKLFEYNGYRKAHIVDIQAENGSAMQEVIRAAETFAKMHATRELNLWTNPHDIYRSDFEQEDFHLYEKDPPDRLIIRFNDNNKEPLEDGYWCFNLSDNDVY